MMTLLALFVASGVLLVLIALPLLFGKVPPNSFYGFRVAATLDSPRLWYAVNQHAAKRLIVSGVSLIAAALLLYFVPGMTVDIYALGCLAVFGVVFGFGLVQSFRYIRATSMIEDDGPPTADEPNTDP